MSFFSWLFGRSKPEPLDIDPLIIDTAPEAPEPPAVEEVAPLPIPVKARRKKAKPTKKKHA